MQMHYNAEQFGACCCRLCVHSVPGLKLCSHGLEAQRQGAEVHGRVVGGSVFW